MTENVGKDRLADRLTEIGERCARLPVYDSRTPDEIIGYDEFGVPSPSGDFSQTDIKSVV
jgi:hypothetical protein